MMLTGPNFRSAPFIKGMVTLRLLTGSTALKLVELSDTIGVVAAMRAGKARTRYDLKYILTL